MKTTLLCLLILLVWYSAGQAIGIAVASPTTTTAFSCLVDQGNSILMVRAYKANDTYHGIDPYGFQSLLNANAAKSQPSNAIKTIQIIKNAYMEPCRNKSSPFAQVREMFNRIFPALFSTLYVKVQPCPNPDCSSWQFFTHQENCDFLIEYLRQIRAKSKSLQIGVFSTANIWAKFFGNTCDTIGLDYPILWYANYENNGHCNFTQSFDDFIPFGGWTIPTLKQTHGNTTATQLCNHDWHVFLDRVWTSHRI